MPFKLPARSAKIMNEELIFKLVAILAGIYCAIVAWGYFYTLKFRKK